MSAMTDETREGSACECQAEGRPGSAWKVPATYTTAAAVAAFLGGLALGLAGVSAYWLLYAAALILAGWTQVPGAIRSALRLRPNMNLLIVLVAVGAAFLGEWMEAALVVLLFSLSEAMERINMDRTRGALRRLMDMVPERATLIRGSERIQAGVGQVEVGSLILIRPGDRIPLDGTIRSGRTHVDQAPVTGESLPAAKGPGDEVFAGTLNQEGMLQVEVTRPHTDTTLARIIGLVEEAASGGTRTQRLADRFAAYYTPAVMVAAVAVMAGGTLITGDPVRDWVYRGMAVILIACPCALVLSAPSAVISGLSAAARQGVLIKSGEHLETAGLVRTVLFDKTGTLSTGRPRVERIVPMSTASEGELLHMAASAEYGSEHPLGQAVLQRASDLGIIPVPPEDFRAVPGRGVVATLAQGEVRVGQPEWVLKWAREAEPGSWDRLAAQVNGATSVLVSADGQIQGLISISDTVRPEAEQAADRLRSLGVTTLGMITGDNPRAAAGIARQLGLGETRAGLLPQDKVEAVRDYRSRGPVMVVGDGINDAPALAAADLGVAMGAAGTDAALETADVALMSDDLNRVPFLIALGRAVRSVIYQNIALALGLKGLALLAAALGHMTLWMAVLADTGVTLLVVSNGLRILAWGQRSVGT